MSKSHDIQKPSMLKNLSIFHDFIKNSVGIICSRKLINAELLDDWPTTFFQLATHATLTVLSLHRLWKRMKFVEYK